MTATRQQSSIQDQGNQEAASAAASRASGRGGVAVREAGRRAPRVGDRGNRTAGPTADRAAPGNGHHDHHWSQQMSQKQQTDRGQPYAKQAHASGKGDMTVREAGQLGGHKGGQRERELVQKGHEAENRGGRRH